MRNRISKRFILRSGLISLIAILVSFFLIKIVHVNFGWYFISIPIVAFMINIVSLLASTGETALRNAVFQISILFFVKFFSYILLSLLFFLLESDLACRIKFISFIFGVYFANMFILVAEIQKYFKSPSAKH